MVVLLVVDALMLPLRLCMCTIGTGSANLLVEVLAARLGAGLGCRSGLSRKPHSMAVLMRAAAKDTR